MTFDPGSRFGPFVLQSLLGTGGMGEVYRAHDTRLKRDVALKFLPATSAADPERLARFQREAHVLASLDHPHIAAIYGIEEADGITALVLQLVEGDTLADRIARGPIPLDEAIPIARQMAEALEAAHEQGIIHRDLKPANVKITPDGHVKVLDFGLAKFSETSTDNNPARSTAHAAATMSPTITTPALMTSVGVILGTAAYMSPEQAKGRAADKRSDVWAYGCVLYEMLTGRRAFEGDDVAETLAAVIRGEPDWKALPSGLPAALVAALKRCVTKDRRERIGDIAAVLFALRESSAVGSSKDDLLPAARPERSRLRTAASYLLTAAVAGAVTSAAWWTQRPPVARPQTARFDISLPDDQRLLSVNLPILAMSHDGTKVAYAANDGIHLRSISDAVAPVLVARAVSPAFSPDGQWLAFFSIDDRTLRKIPVTGGASIKLLDLVDAPWGIDWDKSGIVFGQGEGGIVRVSEDGGKPEVIVKVGSNELSAAPSFLPDGDSLLFSLVPATTGSGEAHSWDNARVVAQSLKTGRRTTLVEGGSDARYVGTGHLLYGVEGVLWARPFNPHELRFTGAALPVIEGIRRGVGNAPTAQVFNGLQFGVSDTGSATYVRGPVSTSSRRTKLVLNDQQGVVTPLNLPWGPYYAPRVSPDGTRIAYTTDDGKDMAVWIYDLDGKTAARRLTVDGQNRYPVWSGDGQWIAFQSSREGDLGVFRQRADGTGGKPERLTKPEAGAAHAPESWSTDGRVLLFSATKGSDVTLGILSLPAGTITVHPGLRSDRWPNAVLSPDGKHVAYSTRASSQRRNTLYVEPFPPTGEKRLIASGDAQMPVWSRDGRALFFVDPQHPDNGRVGFSRVAIDTLRGFPLSEPVKVPRRFEIAGPSASRPRTFDILPDGHFIGVASETELEFAAAPRIEVVLNWFEELKQRVPVR